MRIGRSDFNTDVPHAITGHLPAFNADPLWFLTDCGRYNRGVLSLRILHKKLFLLLEPADIEQVLITDHRNFIKPEWLRTPFVNRLLGDGLVNSEGPVWRTRHDGCRHAFENSRMERYAEMISELSLQRIDTWTAGEAINLQREMTQLTLEVAGRLLFGADPTVPDWVTEVADALDTLMVCFGSRYSLFGMGPLPASSREIRAARRLDSVITNLISQRLEQSGSDSQSFARQDLVSMMPGYQCEGSDRAQLHGQVKTFLGAGSESSSVALTWALVLLAGHPEEDARLYTEVRSVLGNTMRSPTLSDLTNMPYTRAVISEALRLYPPLWMIGRQAIEATTIGECAIPAGGIVMTSPWLMQRSARIFSDPNTFRPERWLGSETESIPRGAYFPFGAGPRICMGRNFAMIESCLVLAAIVNRYQVEIPRDEPIIPWPTVTLRTPHGLRAQLIAR